MEKTLLLGEHRSVPSTTVPLVELVNLKGFRFMGQEMEASGCFFIEDDPETKFVSNQSKPAGPKVGSDDAQMTIEVKNNSLYTYLGGWRIKFSFQRPGSWKQTKDLLENPRPRTLGLEVLRLWEKKIIVSSTPSIQCPVRHDFSKRSVRWGFFGVIGVILIPWRNVS